MRGAKVKPTWDSANYPTPAEWVDWFLANDRGSQEEIAAKAIRYSEDSLDCFVYHIPGCVVPE